MGQEPNPSATSSGVYGLPPARVSDVIHLRCVMPLAQVQFYDGDRLPVVVPREGPGRFGMDRVVLHHIGVLPRSSRESLGLDPVTRPPRHVELWCRSCRMTVRDNRRKLIEQAERLDLVYIY